MRSWCALRVFVFFFSFMRVFKKDYHSSSESESGAAAEDADGSALRLRETAAGEAAPPPPGVPRRTLRPSALTVALAHVPVRAAPLARARNLAHAARALHALPRARTLRAHTHERSLAHSPRAPV